MQYKSNLEKMREYAAQKQAEKQKDSWKQRYFNRNRMLSTIEDLKQLLESAQNAIQHDNYELLKQRVREASIQFGDLKWIVSREQK